MKIELNSDDLRPIIEAAVAATIQHTPKALAQLNVRLAYLEAEAAALIGVQRHVLRDARLRGEITGSKVGKRIVYTQQDLIHFLDRQRF